jgi:hypothetical protein
MIASAFPFDNTTEDNPTEEEEVLSHELTLALAVGVSVAIVSDEQSSFGRLNENELQAMRQFETEHRKRCWTRGRLALKKLLERFGQETDTTVLQFPHCSYSVTHCGHLSMAIACNDEKDSERTIIGVGIDLEFARELDAKSARIFLTTNESLAAEPEQLLRLWTVKEAMFKSDPHNGGCLLTDYATDDWRQYCGEGSSIKSGRGSIQYCSIGWKGGFVSAAVSRSR